MDVRFNKAGGNEPAGEIDCFGLGPKIRFDRNDFTVVDCNIGGAATLAGKPGVPENEVYASSLHRALLLAEIGAHERGVGAHLRRRACMLYGS